MTDKTPKAAPATAPPPNKSISMHDNAPLWDDCCTCAAEPYWLEIGEQIERERQERLSDTDKDNS